jgi:hypothetical protein
VTLSPATVKDFVITTMMTEGRRFDGEWLDAVVRAAGQQQTMKDQFYVVNRLMEMVRG